MSRAVYTLLLRLWLPWHALGRWWRGRREPVLRSSLAEHLARDLPARDDRPLWLHAASVGEVQALAGLLELLRESHAHLPLLVTVGTPAGLARARLLFAPAEWTGLTVLAAPWDLPGVAQRFLDAMRPRAGVFVETELWPNLIAAAASRSIPLALVSARVSARSLVRYRRWASGLMQATVRAFGWIGAQSAEDAARFVSLGADPSLVQVAGNLKFDMPLPPGILEQGAALRARAAPARPLWVAGSTHEGEEAQCLAAQRELESMAAARGQPLPLLVLAPRRPERFAQVAQWLAAQHATHVRSSSGEAVEARTSVLLVDRIGELLTCYAAADVAFVGGTLVPVGGHNLLEPAALAKPVLAGPCTINAPEAARLLEECGALRRVRDGASLALALQGILDDPALARALGTRAAAAVAANRGAAARALSAIAGLAELGERRVRAAAPGPSASG